MREDERETMINEQDEFDDLYYKFYNLIMDIAMDHVHDYHTAEDITQVVLFRLCRYYKSMPKEKIRPWLITTTSHYSIDVLRKGGKHKEFVGLPEMEKLIELKGTQNNINEYLENMAARELLSTSLMKLREKNGMWYDILVLAEVMKVPRKDVAEEYKIALTTVDGHLSRAKKWLNKNFGKEYRSL